MCGSGYTTYPNFLPPTLNIFSPFWSNFSSEKENRRQGSPLTEFFFDMNPNALRKAKIVYNFGLSECNRVKRKTVVLSKDRNVIFLHYFLIFKLSKVGKCILRKKVFKKKKVSYLPTLFFSGCNLNHTYFLFGLNDFVKLTML